jgi:WD40 repeat protein
MSPRVAHATARWALGLTACVLSAGLAHFALAADDPTPAAPKATAPGAAAADAPLPEGALARLGTSRWRHSTPVTYLAFTPDGKSMLTASQDDVVRLWDVCTGTETRRIDLKPKQDPIAANQAEVQRRLAELRAFQASGFGGAGIGPAVTLSPDGKMLAATLPTSQVQLWDVTTGKPGRRFEGVLAGPGGLGVPVFSGDGKLLAVRSGDQAIHVWETATGKELRQLKAPQDKTRRRFFPGNGASLAFAPDGKMLAATDTLVENNLVVAAVRLWEPDTGKELHRLAARPSRGQASLAFAPDGKTLAFANGSAVYLYEAATGKELWREPGQPTGMTTLAFAPDGKTLAVKDTLNGQIHLHDTATGKIVGHVGGEKPAATRQPFFRGAVGARDLAFAPISKVLATGAGTMVRFWDPATGREIPQGAGHQDAITALVLAPGGKLVASHGADDTVRLWEPATGRELHQFTAPPGTVCVALAPDGRSAALGNADTSIRIHATADGKELHRIKGHPQGVAQLAFTPDGKILASGGRLDNVIRLWDPATGRELRQLGMANAVRGSVGSAGGGLVFSPDGKFLACPVVSAPDAPRRGGAPATVTLNLWDVATGKEARRIALPDQTSISSFAFSPDGRTLAAENRNGTITLWEVASGQERGRLGNPAALIPPRSNAAAARLLRRSRLVGPVARAVPTTLAFSADGRILMLRGPQHAVEVWDVESGKEVGRLRGHAGDVTVLALASDGRTLATGSSDTTMLLWDVKRLRPEARPRIAALTDAEAATVWADLRGADAARAFESMQWLTASPGSAVALLRRNLKPATPANPKQLEQWLVGLGSDRFRERQQATQELEKLGELALPALNKLLASEPPLETRRRAEQLVKRLTRFTLSGEELRQVRALEVLERLGTAEARQLLQALAAGAPGALPTREAQAALDRLHARASAP